MTAVVILAGLAASIGANMLGDAAAALNTGQWTEIKNTGRLTRDFLDTRGFNTSFFSILQYANNAVWDPGSRQFLFVGSPHDNPHKYILYSADSNAWRTGPLPIGCMNQGNLTGCGYVSHAYNHNAIDPATGDHYLRIKGDTFYRFNVPLNRWLPLPPVPAGVMASTNTSTAVQYFPDMGGLVYVDGGISSVGFYNPATFKWSLLKSGVSMGSIYIEAAYSPAHACVIFGGGESNANLYRLDASGLVSAIAAPPQTVRVPGAGYCNGSNFIADPVSGNILAYFIGDGFFAEYDPAADRWGLLPAPPAGLKSPQCQGVVSAPVSTYGVVMYLVYDNPPRVYLYKHKDLEIAAERAAAAEPPAIHVSPNPAREMVILRMAAIPGSLSMVDSRGRKAWTLVPRPRGRIVEAAWRASEAAPGVYLVRAVFGKLTLTRTLAVVR